MRNKKVTFQISGTTQKGALFGLLLNFKKPLLHIVAPPTPISLSHYRRVGNCTC